MITHAQSIVRDPTGSDSTESGTSLSNFVAMRHDLEAQVINTRGLVNEIKYILEQMEKLIETEKGQLPANFITQMSELMNHDLGPCIRFQHQSTEALEKIMSRYLDSTT